MTNKDIITIILSLLATTVSLFTFYRSIKKRQHLTISMTNSSLGYTGSGSYADVVLANNGNQPLAIKDIVLMIHNMSASPIDYNLRNIEAGKIEVVRLNVNLSNVFNEAKKVFAAGTERAIDFECMLEMTVFDTLGEERRIKFSPGIVRVAGGAHSYQRHTLNYKKVIQW